MGFVLVLENILGNEKILVLALDKNILKKFITALVLDSKKKRNYPSLFNLKIQ